jgi:hypothetical protein
LTSIEIPDSVTNIDEAAFKGCSNLISVENPNTVPSIGDYGFADCSNIKNVFVNWTTPILLGGTVFYNSSNLSGITLYVPYGTKADYQAAPAWKDFGTVAEITPELTVPAEEIAFAFGGGQDSVIVISNMG